MKLVLSLIMLCLGLIPSVTSCDELMTAETSIASWEGIPLPPGTKLYRKAGPSMIASNENAFEQIECWYLSNMTEAGWRGTVAARTDHSIFGGPVVSLRFARDGRVASIMLTFVPSENYTMLQLTWLDGKSGQQP